MTLLRRAFRGASPLAVVLTCLTMGVLARADAPPDQYDTFDLKDTVIHDAKTGLYWQRQVAPTQTATFSGATAYCAGLALGSYGSGWRVPSYKELLTLVDESPHVEYPKGPPVNVAIDPNAFPLTPADPLTPYWTSSADPNPVNAGDAFAVEFSLGNAKSLPQSSVLFVRCVHD